MVIRNFNQVDLFTLERLHRKFFADQFELPNFLDKFFCAITIEDVNGILAIGGVRTIAECILVTNMDRTARDRRNALYAFLHAAAHFSAKHDYNQLHAFVQDEVWAKHLKKVGFSSTKGQALVIGV